jgi:GNAT superfamily N-acetyltransferase
MASFFIVPATYADIPVLARIAAEPFEKDRHTQMQRLGDNPYDMEAEMLNDFKRRVESANAVIVKAVDECGEILGLAAWGFRGLRRDEMPFLQEPLAGERKEEKVEEETDGEAKVVKAEEDKNAEPNNDPISRLQRMTGANMKYWMEKLMPDGVRCMFVAGFHVAPKHQRRGVGAALMKWGTDIADEMGVFIWVHSSEASAATYRKAGFETIGRLDIDLDEYAPCPPPKKVGGDIWGHYVFEYMKYLPKSIS